MASSNKRKTQNRPINTARPAESTSIKPRVSQTKDEPPKSDNTALFIIGGIVLLAVVVLVALLAFGGNKPTPTPEPGAPASAGDISVAIDPEAQVRNFPDLGSAHLTSGQKVSDLVPGGYNSNPPTSGPHLPTWSNWGVLNDRQQDELLVHNLEHGGIVMFYDCPQGCTTAVNTLATYARRYPAQNFTGILLAPRPLPNGARISLSAWGNQLLLKTVDVDKINKFIAQFIGKGPERDPNFRP